MAYSVVVAAPLDPSADEARRSVVEELTKPEYLAAQPTWIDRLAQTFNDWLDNLHFGDLDVNADLAPVVLVAIVVAVLVVVFLVYGVPRLNRRSSRDATVFGDDDERGSDEIRAAARSAAATGDFSTAIVEQFRAVARFLSERGDLTTTPGTTAHSVGERAGALLPELSADFAFSARAFDEVRYLDRVGTEDSFRRVEALDSAVRGRRAAVRL